MPKVSTSYKPGQSGNPNGRPKKGYSITEMMKEMLSAEPDLKKTIGKVIAKKALEGDITAIKTLWGYMDGLPTQPIEGSMNVTTNFVTIPSEHNLETPPETDRSTKS